MAVIENAGGSSARQRGQTIVELVEEQTGQIEDLEMLYYEARAVIDEGRLRTGTPVEITDREWVASLKQKEKAMAVGETKSSADKDAA